MSGVAIVTGASRGIGKACMTHLARKGFDIVVCARTVREGQAFEHSPTIRNSDSSPLPGSLETTAAEVQALSRRALIVKLDLLERRDMENLVERTMEDFGRIDVLVNNARYVGPGHMDLFVDTPMEVFDNHLQCNTFAPLYLDKLVVPVMIDQGGGLIVNIGSSVGSYESPLLPGQGGWGLGYSINKAAFNRIALGLAKKLKQHNVAVINLEPGFVATERVVQDMGELGSAASRGLPVDVPGAACALLATSCFPLLYRCKTVYTPDLVIEHGLFDPAAFPVPTVPKAEGCRRRAAEAVVTEEKPWTFPGRY
jgi:NAD(P)-dependent dehydrogenase (short-subunit alcohol dehydrogenase family)